MQNKRLPIPVSHIDTLPTSIVDRYRRLLGIRELQKELFNLPSGKLRDELVAQLDKFLMDQPTSDEALVMAQKELIEAENKIHRLEKQVERLDPSSDYTIQTNLREKSTKKVVFVTGLIFGIVISAVAMHYFPFL